MNNQRPNVDTIQRLTQRPPTASEQLCELTRSHSPAGRLLILPAEPPNKVHIGHVISSWTMQLPKQPKQYHVQFCFIPFQGAISQSGIFQQPIYLLFNCHLQTLAGLFCHHVNQPPYITCCIQASPFLHRKKCTGGLSGVHQKQPPPPPDIYICSSRWVSDIKAKALHFILWGSRNVYNS